MSVGRQKVTSLLARSGSERSAGRGVGVILRVIWIEVASREVLGSPDDLVWTIPARSCPLTQANVGSLRRPAATFSYNREGTYGSVGAQGEQSQRHTARNSALPPMSPELPM
jgi:hypothetical protein